MQLCTVLQGLLKSDFVTIMGDIIVKVGFNNILLGLGNFNNSGSIVHFYNFRRLLSSDVSLALRFG